MTTAAKGPAATRADRLVWILLVGAVVSVFFGTYAHVHDPAGEATISLFFSGTLNLKVWFTTAALLFAALQILTALRIYGKVKIPKEYPSWLGDAHRLFGTLAFVVTLPVAFHCLWSLGFSDKDARTYIHSLAGCAFYGVFVIKVLSVRTKQLPNWVLPVVGSTAFALLVLIWSTSSLWFFQNVDFPGI